MTTFAPLLDLLAEVPDPRRAQEQIDKLPYVLLFSTLAIMTGGNSYRSSVTFIDANRRKLNAAFGLHWRRAPAHTAIRYILQGLDERARPTPRRCKRSGSDGCRRSGWDKPWEGLGGHARAQQNCAEHRAGGAREHLARHPAQRPADHHRRWPCCRRTGKRTSAGPAACCGACRSRSRCPGRHAGARHCPRCCDDSEPHGRAWRGQGRRPASEPGGTPEVGPVELGPSKIGPAEVGLVEVGHVEVSPA